MGEKEKRISERKKVSIITYIRKTSSEKGYDLMQFLSRDYSNTGVYIFTDDLSVFKLGDEVEIMIDSVADGYKEGKAKVVRAARHFSEKGDLFESGYGLMFLSPPDDFKGVVIKQLDNK